MTHIVIGGVAKEQERGSRKGEGRKELAEYAGQPPPWRERAAWVFGGGTVGGLAWFRDDLLPLLTAILEFLTKLLPSAPD